MKPIVFMCLALLLLLACKKSSSSTEPKAGQLEVDVTLYDQFGNKQANADSVVVTIISSAYNYLTNTANLNLISPYYYKDTTNAFGKFLFNNLQKDTTYTFIFTRKNYGTIIKYNIKFEPESAPFTLSANLAKISSTTVSDLKFTPVYYSPGVDTVWLTCKITSLQSPYSSVRFFWGTDSRINPDSNYIQTVLCNTNTNYNVLSPGLIGFYFVPSLYNVDSGATLYGLAYGEANDPTLYTNIAVKDTNYPNGITKFPNLNAIPLTATTTVP